MGPHLSYFICTTPRSGSELLCDYLKGSAIAGYPEEWFHESNFSFLFKAFNVTNFIDYFPVVMKERSPAGIFAAKVMGGPYFDEVIARFKSLPALKDQNLSPIQIVECLFPNIKYIWLTRRNKVRQAISLSKAFQSNIWQSHVNKTDTKEVEPVFSFPAVNDLLQNLVLEDVGWQEYFSEARSTPFTVVYEDFVQNREKTVRDILEFLEISVPSDWSLDNFQPRPKKLSDQSSDKWFEAYVAKNQSRFAHLHNLPDSSYPLPYNERLRNEHFQMINGQFGDQGWLCRAWRQTKLSIRSSLNKVRRGLKD
jgi:trehalose 2-sulfotransferase